MMQPRDQRQPYMPCQGGKYQVHTVKFGEIDFVPVDERVTRQHHEKKILIKERLELEPCITIGQVHHRQVQPSAKNRLF